MLQFSPNLTMLFLEVPLLDRFHGAAECGFTSVEMLFPYEQSVGDLRRAMADSHTRLSLFDFPAGDWESGERGIAAFPDRRPEFRDSVDIALSYATALGTTRVNCLAGLIAETPQSEAWSTLCENIQYAADAASKVGVTILVEPLNAFDYPDVLLGTVQQAVELIHMVKRSNVKIQYDLYHAQRSGGELIGTYQRFQPNIGHIQVADNPGRHQPGTGEVFFDNVLDAIDCAGYDGYIGLEYVPIGRTVDSLKWLRSYQEKRYTPAISRGRPQWKS